MTTSRKVALACVTGAIAIALAVPLYTGALKVYAAMGLSDDVDIFIDEPVSGGGILGVNVATTGGADPDSLKVEVEADVDSVVPITGVEVALNGDIDDIARTLTGPDDQATAEEFDDVDSLWGATIDLAAGTFEDFTGTPGPITPLRTSTSVVRALASAAGYYGGRDVVGFADYDSFNVSVNVFDAADVDTNGNGKPDAQALGALTSGIIVSSDVISVWGPLDGSTRGTQTFDTVSYVLDSLAGSVFVDLIAPNLAALQAANAAYLAYDDGRLELAMAALPETLLDGPVDVDPLSEFTLPGSPPENLFSLVNIMIRDSAAFPPVWTILDTLPPGLDISLQVSGPGVDARLNDTVNVNSFTYDTTRVAAGPQFTDIGDEAGWAPATTTLQDLGRASRVYATNTTDSVTATFASASVIAGIYGLPPVNFGSLSGIPVITLTGPPVINLDVGGTYVEAGATAIDPEDGDISGSIVIGGDVVDTSTAGTYIVTYDVTDSDANAAVQVTRTVNVNSVGVGDIPVITLLGVDPETHEAGDAYADAGATATDTEDGDLTGSIVVGGDTVDATTVPGAYTITYNVTDSDTNAAVEVTRTVNVVDTTAPEITLDGEAAGDSAASELLLDDVYVALAATAADSFEGDVSGSIVVGGDVVDSATLGDYVVTYDVSDSSGNAALTVTHTVSVVETLSSGGSSSSGICFIATAAYGTPLADDIHVLRDVRDSYMLNTAVGSAFVDAYYRVSPPIADVVADSALLRSVVRTLLTPIVILSSFVLAMPGVSVVLVAMAGLLAAARLRRKVTQR